MRERERTLIVGIGGDHGDDCAGLLAAERLARLPAGCRVRAIRHPADLPDLLEGVDRLHLIDACRGLDPGETLRRCEWPASELSAVRFGGTHDLDLVGILRLAERLQLLPRETTIWCIEAADTGMPIAFSEPSATAAAAVDQVVEAIAREIGAGGGPRIAEAGHA